jgi:hypothetical protein
MEDSQRSGLDRVGIGDELNGMTASWITQLSMEQRNQRR